MANSDRALRSRRVVLPDGVRPAAVVVAAGRIAAVAPWSDPPVGVPLDDLGELALLPGLVDTHVHVNEPGRTHWEGFASATRAAAAGGITTIVDMPLNAIPATTTAGALAAKREAADGRVFVDVGFWGGAVPGNLDHLAPLAAAGVLGFKAFLSPSGVDEFAAIDLASLWPVARRLAELGLPLLVHAESPEELAAAARALAGDPRAYGTWLASRPPIAELRAIEGLIEIARETGAHVHVVHLACRVGLEALARARAAGTPVTVETCPHYLTFAAEEIADGATEWKCAPPIRGATERDALWRGLADGAIDLVASDHSPSPPDLKWRETGDFLAAWGGIASLQVALAATWTGAAARGFGLDRIAGWMAAGPARLAGLAPRKGAIAAGADADLVVFDPEATFRVDARSLYHRHPVTPYDGRTLRGTVRAVYLAGEPVAVDGVVAGEPRGRLLRP